MLASSYHDQKQISVALNEVQNELTCAKETLRKIMLKIECVQRMCDHDYTDVTSDKPKVHCSKCDAIYGHRIAPITVSVM